MTAVDLLLGDRLDPAGLGELGGPDDVHADDVDVAVLGRQPAHELLALLVGVVRAGRPSRSGSGPRPPRCTPRPRRGTHRRLVVDVPAQDAVGAAAPAAAGGPGRWRAARPRPRRPRTVRVRRRRCCQRSSRSCPSLSLPVAGPGGRPPGVWCDRRHTLDPTVQTCPDASAVRPARAAPDRRRRSAYAPGHGPAGHAARSLPMLAKADARAPRARPRASTGSSPSGTASAASCSATATRSSSGSRNERPLTRYFPELLEPLRAALPDRCVVDGEIVVAGPDGLDFDALQQRIHPAESRVNMLAGRDPGVVRRLRPARPRRRVAARRRRWPSAAACSRRSLGRRRGRRSTSRPGTYDRDLAPDWFVRFEGAGLDGVMAKAADGTYQPDKRAQLKVKHQRTADCVVAGFRVHKSGDGVGSLLLGLYDDEGRLHHLGVASSFSAARAGRAARRAGALRAPTTSPTTRGASGSTPRPTPRPRPAGCPARRRAGTPRRTCRSRRSDPSWWPRSRTSGSTTAGSATPPASSAGARTAIPRRARSTSSRWSRPWSCRWPSAATSARPRDAGAHPAPGPAASPASPWWPRLVGGDPGGVHRVGRRAAPTGAPADGSTTEVAPETTDPTEPPTVHRRRVAPAEPSTTCPTRSSAGSATPASTCALRRGRARRPGRADLERHRHPDAGGPHRRAAAARSPSTCAARTVTAATVDGDPAEVDRPPPPSSTITPAAPLEPGDRGRRRPSPTPASPTRRSSPGSASRSAGSPTTRAAGSPCPSPTAPPPGCP